MEPLEIVRRRLAAQRLVGAAHSSPAEVVAHLGAMQAQEFGEALWSVAQRMDGATEAEVEAAFARGEILRTHVLRPTWHFVAAEDLPWLLRLSGPRVQAKNRPRYRNLGLDDDRLLARAHEVLAEAVAGGGTQTRRELAVALERSGIDVEGQRLVHIVMSAELDGVLCSGPRRGRHHTYMLLEERAPAVAERSREEALAELAGRYFRSRGPATARDFSAWSGLTVGDARRGAAAAQGVAELFRHDDEPFYGDPSQMDGDPGEAALLLATYDEMLMGYGPGLRLVFDTETARGQEPGRVIVIDGRAVGEWRRRLLARRVAIEVDLFRPLKGDEESALLREAERFGRFLGRDARLTVSAG